MDPFTAVQVVAAALEFAHTCMNIAILIKNARKLAKAALEELAVLESEAETAYAIGRSVKQVVDEMEKITPQLPQDEQQRLNSSANGMLKVVKATTRPLKELTDILNDFQTVNETATDGTINSIRTIWRGYRKKDEIQRLHREIASSREQIQAYCSLLSITYLMRHHQLTTSSLNTVSDDIRSLSTDTRAAIEEFRFLSFELKKKRHLIEHEEQSVDSLLGSITEWNQHFCLTQSVQTFYTGRETLLTELKSAFDEPQTIDKQVQRRFVVHGFPGSGKTEFSNKFAVQYKESFWGVFVVDASSHASAANSFCRIAQRVVGKDVEKDMSAAKQWLASCRSPWLLIIDNADDPKLEIEQYFPPGNNGCVLITTRNWALTSVGTVGKYFYSFERLEKPAAKQVLIRAAGERHPWSPETVAAADEISDQLYCLPLALVYAGQAIRTKLCTWRGYIKWFTKTRKRYSQKKSRSVSNKEEDVKLTLISTFEPLLDLLEDEESEDQTSIDARQLMYTFGFLHHNDITFDLLKKMVVNANIDGFTSTDEIPVDDSLRPSGPKKKLEKNVLNVAKEYRWLFVGEPVLPNVLRGKPLAETVEHNHRSVKHVDTCQSDGQSPLDEDRLRAALSLLERRALIRGYKENSDEVYYLHPLVSDWIRDRMPTTSQKAIWYEAAAQALSQCIVLEPKAFIGQSSSHFDSAQLLNHVNSLRRHKAAIEAEFNRRRDNRRMLSWPPCPVTGPNFTTRIVDSTRLMQYSLIYSQCGKYKEAGELQREVRDRAVKSRGMNNEITISVSLALAGTLQNLAEFTEACRIQKQVVKACEKLYGPNYFTTLENVDRLGLLLFYHGKLLKSSGCHRRALDGFIKLRDRYQNCECSDTALATKYRKFAVRCERQAFIAQNHLGAVEGRYLDWKQSKKTITEALNGLKKLDRDQDDEEVLWAKENLAFTCCELDDDESRWQAYELMVQVRAGREKRLGKQHPYTLWAHVNLGRALWKLRRFDEGLKEIDYAREIALVSESLGPGHFGFLAGEVVRGCILTDKGAFEEAHKVLDFVDRGLEKISIERGVDHLDRIIALQKQLNLFEIQGKLPEAIAVGRKILKLLEGINKKRRGVSHPLYAIIEAKVNDLEDMLTMEYVPHGLQTQLQEPVRRRIAPAGTW